MRFLLVTSEPGWIDALRALFPPADAIVPTDVRQLGQNPALAAAADACFVAETALSPASIESLKQLSGIAETPLFLLTDGARSQWEEAALFAGAQQIFRRPFKANIVQLAVSRCQRSRRVEPTVPSALVATRSAAEGGAELSASLALWREFSELLLHVGDAPELVELYLDKLRQVLRCNRVVLYLADAAARDDSFRCAHASGVPTSEFESFPVSATAGAIQALIERGTVLWRHRLQVESARDAAAARELMVFGAELAVPIRGSRGMAGALFVGPRISGATYTDSEVTLLYHALESMPDLLTPAAEAGDSASKDATAMLHAMPIPAALVGANLKLIDVNGALRSLVGRNEATPLTFDDIPAAWAAAISAAVQGRAASARVEVDHQLIGAPRKLRLSVRRLEASAGTPTFLVTLEDTTPAATAAQEADSHSIQNLLQRAGEQLSNEFRNALTPVDIMVQLSRETTTSRSELERLGNQVSTAIHRLRRRIDDLAYLTKSAIIPEPTTVSSVLRFTRERLDDWLEDKHLKRIVWLNEFCETPMTADTRALALALAELVMNAVEACDGRQVTIAAEDATDAVSFRVRNSGVWAPPPESSGFRHRPFVSAKSTGVGLGVEVASRVAENHGGRLALGPVSSDMIEAILRIPRNVPIAPSKVETRAARSL